MLNTITQNLLSTTAGNDITSIDVVLSMVVALGLGMIIALTYLKTNKTAINKKSFALTLVMIPIVLSVIILFVGSNVARAFSLAGVLSIIRFRSAPGDAKDIGYIFFSTAIGVGCGVGMYGGCAIFAVLMSLIMLLLEKMNLGNDGNAKLLRITIPEDLNFEHVFDEIFEKYTSQYELNRIKTTDLGSLYEANYKIILKPEISEKSFIDELRVRNGNLNIILTMQGE